MNAGQDEVFGGTRRDTVVFAGVRSDYQMVVSDGVAEVTGKNGYALLNEVEVLRFVDGSPTIDLNSREAKIARMYDTTLDRGHDAGGLRAWTGGLDAGMSLKQIADGFMASPEFQTTYGALDDIAFVKQLYLNILDRAGEDTDVQAWVGGLKGSMSRSEIVVGFSESNEHAVKLAGVIDDGIHVYI
jgi:hypothetical protein